MKANEYQILIVDDVISNLKLLEKILGKHNYRVFKALSGAEAIDLASKNEFVLALIDVVMPEMDGLETAKALRQIPLNKDLPVIFLSAILKEQRDIIKGFEEGAFDYVIKPYDSTLILSKIKVFCRLFEQRKLLEQHNEELVGKNTLLEETITESNRIRNELELNKKELQNHQEHLEEMIELRTRELKVARNIAEEATKAKSDFLSTICHELRTPLHQILGFTKMGLDGIFQDNLKKLSGYFQEVFSAAQRMQLLQNNLLDLSKLENNEVIFDFQNTSLSSVINNIVSEYQKRSLDEKIKIETEFLKKDDNITIDIQKFEQVLRNVLNNAFTFSDPGSVIKIKVLNKGDHYHIFVIDSGVGIPEKELISVFDKFRKSSHPRSVANGTGLGLYISNMIITGHKGKISAEINQKGGTIIKIELPKSQQRHKKLIGQLLIEKGYLTREQLAEVLEGQAK